MIDVYYFNSKKYVYQIAFTRGTTLKQLVFTCLVVVSGVFILPLTLGQCYNVTLFSNSDMLVAVPEHRSVFVY